MATYNLTIYGDRVDHDQFEAHPSDVTINTSGEGTKITVSPGDGSLYQAFIPTGVPYTLESGED